MPSESVISEATWLKVLVRDEFMCLNCNATDELAPAHYHSRGAGGEVEDTANIMTLCFRCHRRHHDGTLTIKRINGRFFFREKKKR